MQVFIMARQNVADGGVAKVRLKSARGKIYIYKPKIDVNLVTAPMRVAKKFCWFRSEKSTTTAC